jgi:hypothetical protein
LFNKAQEVNKAQKQRKMKQKDSGVFHLIYVSSEEERNKSKEGETLQTNLDTLTEIGIEKGITLINQSYSETSDAVRQLMFPRQTVTKVQFIISHFSL